MIKILLWFLCVGTFSLLMMMGCATVGVECAKSDVRAYAKYRRPGWAISKKQVEAIADFRERVCR